MIIDLYEITTSTEGSKMYLELNSNYQYFFGV